MVVTALGAALGVYRFVDEHWAKHAWQKRRNTRRDGHNGDSTDDAAAGDARHIRPAADKDDRSRRLTMSLLAPRHDVVPPRDDEGSEMNSVDAGPSSDGNADMAVAISEERGGDLGDGDYIVGTLMTPATRRPGLPAFGRGPSLPSTVTRAAAGSDALLDSLLTGPVDDFLPPPPQPKTPGRAGRGYSIL